MSSFAVIRDLQCWPGQLLIPAADLCSFRRMCDLQAFLKLSLESALYTELHILGFSVEFARSVIARQLLSEDL